MTCTAGDTDVADVDADADVIDVADVADVTVADSDVVAAPAHDAHYQAACQLANRREHLFGA